MCGIAGIYYFKKGAVSEKRIDESLAALHKRGPDNVGFYHNEHVFLGHTRLSIIDISAAANQPLSDESERYTLVFNGELFNYKELKASLRGSYTFRTTSDTEVLLYWLIEQGVEGLKRLNGFFAFAFYDNQEQKILLARDHYGIKPLVYAQEGEKFLFCSEIKGLLPFLENKKIDRTALQLYLELSYLPAPFTMLEGVKKLEAGHYVEITSSGWQKQVYYTLPKVEGKEYSQAEVEQNIRKKLETSVQRRLMADVPVATFLSGGIDSSLITALAVRHHPGIQSFSIGFKDDSFFDESSLAEKTAGYLGSKHHSFMLSTDDLFAHFGDALDYLDEPFADSSALNVYVLCKEVGKNVKVALSGDGADELFGGYNKHIAHARAIEKTISNKIIRSVLPLIKESKGNRNTKYTNRLRQAYKYASGLKLQPEARYRNWANWGKADKVGSLLKQTFSAEVDLIWKQQLYVQPHKDELNDLLYNDMRTVLEGDMLRKIDSMSMANSLEVRPPFLDPDLVNYVSGLPALTRYNKRVNKALLKSSFKGFLPEEVFHRPKKGFEVPLTRFVCGPFKSKIEHLLNRDRIEQEGFFNSDKIEKIKRAAFQNAQAEDVYLLWALACFQYWKERYL